MHRRNKATVCAGAVVMAASSLLVAQGAGADPRAGENYRMNGDNVAARGHDLPGLAVDPSNPLHVVAADNDFLNGQCDYHVSFDGGINWTGGHLTAPARFPSPPCQPNSFDSGGYGHTNGSIAFGAGQNVYTTFSSKSGPPQRPENGVIAGEGDSILVAKSTDGGVTFGQAVVAIQGPADSLPYYVRPKLTVVPRASGDQIYVAGWGVKNIINTGASGGTGGPGTNTQRRTVTTVSNDGGTTWSAVVDASAIDEQTREIGTPVAAAGGLAWVTYRNRDTVPSNDPIMVSRTTDGGATWSRVPVSPVTGPGVTFAPNPSATNQATVPIGGGGGHPEIARDVASGNLYVAYQGLSIYPSPTAPAPAIASDSDIFLTRSIDNGATWSAPLRINDDPVAAQLQGAGIPQTQPFVTVAPNGRVDVIWHDRRNAYPGSTVVSGGTAHGSAPRRGSDVYMASSTNGAVSFAPNRRITDRTMNLDVGLEGRVGGSTWYGPGSATMGNDNLLVSLPDSREGNFDNDNQDIYLSRVAMQPTDLRPVSNLTQSSPASGSVALSKLAYPGGLESQAASPVSKVVIVNENDAASALAGSVLARDTWGPLLASPALGLPADVKAEVTRMGAIGGFVIGGTDALSSTVQTDLTAAAPGSGSTTPATPPVVQRLAGANPADTARSIADALDTRTPAQKAPVVAPAVPTPAFPAVVIVNPASPEAAAAAGLAASRRLPILFVDQNSIPAETAAALAPTSGAAGCLTATPPTCRAGLAITKTFVVGGSGAVSDAVVAGLPSPTRLAGADLYGTSEAVVAEARAQGVPSNVVYVADGARPVDAAVLGAAVARLGGQMLLSPGAGPGFNVSLQRLGLAGIADRVVVQLPVGAGNGYREVASDGGIFAFGNASFLGSTGGTVLNAPVVGMAETPTHNGYWNVASDGGIFAFGDAGFYGSTGAITLNKPIVGMSSTPTGKGYWLVASDGGIFSFGDAAFFGSTGAIKLNKPIVGMSSTPTGNGYWLVASDGGIFSYGDAAFKGSTGAIRLVKPVVGMARTPSGNGYWAVASDGGIFSFGDAAFFGSTGAFALNKPVVGMASTPTGKGYRLVASDGGIFSFGDAGFFGSTGALTLFRPIVGMGS